MEKNITDVILHEMQTPGGGQIFYWNIVTHDKKRSGSDESIFDGFYTTQEFSDIISHEKLRCLLIQFPYNASG